MDADTAKLLKSMQQSTVDAYDGIMKNAENVEQGAAIIERVAVGLLALSKRVEVLELEVSALKEAP